MQYRYIGPFELPAENQQKLAEQSEIWALNAALEYGHYNLGRTADAVGTSVGNVLGQLAKYGITVEKK